MSMADDNRLRSYRTNDPYGRAAEPAQPAANIRDPLAELARLLGQGDPFADFGQATRNSREAHDAPATAPADWQGAAAREPQFAAGDSSQRWADYSAAPESSESRFHDDADPTADHQSGYYADERAAVDGRQEPEYYEGHDVPLDPHEDAMYDDPPRARRSRLATALTIIGCAVLGTAGAYAFRSYYGSPSATQAPPVITADTFTSTKIVPAGDPQSGKAVQDRLANVDKEQIVSKQEEPVALKDLANQAGSRVVPPAPAAPGQGASAAQPSAGASSGSNEPKKIRTVTIRTDAGDMSGRPVTNQAALAQAAPAPAATAPRQAATPAAPKAAPARNGGPISLEPQGEPAAATRTRTAAAPPIATRAAPETTESTLDGFMVQLSSQKSEAEAQSSFRSLQAKFPNELGGLAPVVRRADLGSKGVFYRTMVGPFASAQEASQFCANYKAAGGQCVVPNN
ncbi:MAG: SPOR domain-containing protein [Xanthobacteraceae bacterium]